MLIGVRLLVEYHSLVLLFGYIWYIQIKSVIRFKRCANALRKCYHYLSSTLTASGIFSLVSCDIVSSANFAPSLNPIQFKRLS